jgi:hypothetical protein
LASRLWAVEYLRPLGMLWSIPGSLCLLVLCGELSWCPSWSIPAGHPWHGVSRPTTQETETGPQGLKPGDTYTTTSWSIPDASLYMYTGRPVHVWGCRCHLVTLSFGDRITSFYLRPRWEAFRWSIFSGGRFISCRGVCSGAGVFRECHDWRGCGGSCSREPKHH